MSPADLFISFYLFSCRFSINASDPFGTHARMTGLYANQQWIAIAIIFFGVIAYFAYVRRRERKWIDQRFGQQKVLAVSFGVNYFGRASEEGKPHKSNGFLLLLPDRLFYRSHRSRIELDIPVEKIDRVYPGTSIKGVDLHQSVMKVNFINATNDRDSAAFRVPYPPQWIRMIEKTVIKKDAL